VAQPESNLAQHFGAQTLRRGNFRLGRRSASQGAGLIDYYKPQPWPSVQMDLQAKPLAPKPRAYFSARTSHSYNTPLTHICNGSGGQLPDPRLIRFRSWDSIVKVYVTDDYDIILRTTLGISKVALPVGVCPWARASFNIKGHCLA